MRPITSDFSQEDKRPYFFWDEDTSIADLKRVLREGPPEERDRLLGKMLREARDTDVWSFVTPGDVAEALPRVARRVGRRLPFWEFLIDGWREDGATIEMLNESPTFARALLKLDVEAVVVDLVADPVFQLAPEKLEIDGVIVDRPEEILANKLTALVGRQEERDLVDVFALERSGLRVEDYLEAASQKDGGCTPATLAWLLESFPLPGAERLPESISRDELARWRADLVTRLRRAAFPRETPS